METFLFLMVGIAVVMVWASQRNNARLHKHLAKRYREPHFLPQAISLLILTAQIGELVRVVEHTSLVTVSAALLLLAIVVAARSGTEGELR
jgi:hypothetical protein